MDRVNYNQYGGMKTQFNPIDAPQNSFLLVENFVLNREFGALVKRGGTETWSVTGNVLGLGGYVRKLDTNVATPVIEYPIQHLRDGATSTFEYLDWDDNTWKTVSQGTSVSGNIGVGGTSAFAQQDDLLCISAGLPCQMRDRTGPLNRLGGPKPTTAPTVAAGAAGNLTSTGAGYRWVYTFYNSTTGWESSPSSTSDFLSLTAQAGNLSAMETTCDKEDVDQKRIYRTITTGEAPFQLVATIPLGTTTYIDDVTDENLGATAPIAGDHEPPPSTSYVCAAFENRIWVASGSDLYYSKAYAGNSANLEYFSEDRKFSFQQRVTGLTRFQQRLMVFHPPKFGINQIRRQQSGDFDSQEFSQTEGTNWHHSISTHDKYMAYWGATGPRLFNQAGIVDRFDEDIQNYLRQALIADYQQDVNVWSVYHEETDQFLFGFSGNATQACWQETDALNPVRWENCVTGEDVCWEEIVPPTVQDLFNQHTIAVGEDYNYIYQDLELGDTQKTGTYRVYKEGNSTAVATGTTTSNFALATDPGTGVQLAGQSLSTVDTSGLTEGRHVLFVPRDDGGSGAFFRWNARHFMVANNETNICKKDYYRLTAGDTFHFWDWPDGSDSFGSAPTWQCYKDTSETTVANGTMSTFDGTNLQVNGDEDAFYASIDTTGFAAGRYVVFVVVDLFGSDYLQRSYQFTVDTCTATTLGDDCPTWANVYPSDSTIYVPAAADLVYKPLSWSHPSTSDEWRLYPAGSQTAAATGTFSTWDSGNYNRQFMASIDLTGLAVGQYHLFLERSGGTGLWYGREIWIEDCLPATEPKIAPYTFETGTTFNLAFQNDINLFIQTASPDCDFRVFKDGSATPVLTSTGTQWDIGNMTDGAYVCEIDSTGLTDGVYTMVCFLHNGSGTLLGMGEPVQFRLDTDA